jgi:hypothetical protein
MSDLEPLFICQPCGLRGADVRPDFDWDNTTKAHTSPIGDGLSSQAGETSEHGYRNERHRTTYSNVAFLSGIASGTACLAQHYRL